MPGHLVGQIQRLLHAVLNLDSRWWFGWPPGSHLHMRVECSFLPRQQANQSVGKKAWPARSSLSCENLLLAVNYSGSGSGGCGHDWESNAGLFAAWVNHLVERLTVRPLDQKDELLKIRVVVVVLILVVDCGVVLVFLCVDSGTIYGSSLSYDSSERTVGQLYYQGNHDLTVKVYYYTPQYVVH